MQFICPCFLTLSLKNRKQIYIRLLLLMKYMPAPEPIVSKTYKYTKDVAIKPVWHFPGSQ